MGVPGVASVHRSTLSVMGEGALPCLRTTSNMANPQASALCCSLRHWDACRRHDSLCLSFIAVGTRAVCPSTPGSFPDSWDRDEEAALCLLADGHNLPVPTSLPALGLSTNEGAALESLGLLVVDGAALPKAHLIPRTFPTFWSPSETELVAFMGNSSLRIPF